MALPALVAAVVLSASPSFTMPVCPIPAAGTSSKTEVKVASSSSGPEIRTAAQRGIVFLSKATPAWQQANGCYGCHVQAVTLEAFSVGVRNQYEVPKSALDAVLNGMLRLPGGARRPHGLSYHDESLLAPSKAFGGAAFARFDQWVGSAVRDDLWKVAKELREYQQQDGSIRLDWVNPPVGAGTIQGTYQAMQTWRQTFARSADDQWLTPLRRAEKYIQNQVAAWGDSPPSVQDANYALMALVAAGVSPAEPNMRRLEKYVLARQSEDGAWHSTETNLTPAFATGQSLYALRMLGRTDADAVIARGTRWLVKNQQSDGGWSNGGFGKAEAMWGVMGLVSVDVLTVALAGLEDGQRIDGAPVLNVSAKDNQGGGVRQVELFVDDLRVAGACGGTLAHAIDASALMAGKHIIEAVASNGRGERSVRRLELYSGAIYLTEPSSQFADETTTIALRNIAAPSDAGKVRLTIANDKKEPVFHAEQPSTPGPLSFGWSGKSDAGKAMPRGRYTATLAFVDPQGAAKQTVELVFAHQTAEEQKATYAEVQGNLQLGDGRGAATNAPVELVDDDGNVVQRTMSTAAGQYRFKNVDPGKYKVRVQGKKGFKDLAADVKAEAAKESSVDAELKSE